MPKKRVTRTIDQRYAPLSLSSSLISSGGGLVAHELAGVYHTGDLPFDRVDTSGSSFDEMAQDAIGTILADSPTIDFTYTDATPSITAAVIADSIGHTHLADMAAGSVLGRGLGSGTGDPVDLSANGLNGIVGSDNLLFQAFKYIAVDSMQARDGAGLRLKDHTGVTGVLIVSGGDVTLTNPTITNYTNANHTHTGASSGGVLATAAIADDSISNAKLGNMFEALVKGRAVGAGTGDPQDLTATQLNAIVGTANLGLGTSPLAPLHISGANEAIRVTGTGTGAAHVGFITFHDGTARKGYIGDSTAANSDIYLQSDSGAIRLRANALDGIYIESGQVGINNNAPQAALDVAGSAIIGTGAAAASVTIDGAAASSRDILYRTAGVNRWIVRCDGVAETGSNAGSNFSISARQDDGSAFISPLTIIRSTGNLGVRNSSPQANLHVGGGVDAPGQSNTTLYVSNAGATNLSVRDSTNDIEAFLWVSGGIGYVGTFTSHPLRLRTNNNDALFIDATQRVGVGAVPAAKLSVSQLSTTAAIPTMDLTQSDLSEQFINFISTVGAGNAIDTAALGTYYGKVRVSVNGTFKFLALYN